MRIQRHQSTKRFAPLWLALMGVMLLGGAPAARAVEHFVFGQVVQVDPEDAADESLTNAALTGGHRPYSRIRIYDVDTGTLLGESDSDENGVFTVRYDRPPGSTANLDVRVFHLVEDPDTAEKEAVVLPAARTGINSFSGVGQFHGVVLKVIADDVLSYGEEGLVTTSGVGLVFTRVGRVETQFIAQNTTAVGGLADFSSDPTAPGNLGVPDFRQAPFAGRLLVFGDFGLPSSTSGCGGRIDYYRISIQRIQPAGGTAQIWNQPLLKTRTVVTTAPSLSVVHQRLPVGPFAGVLSGALTALEGLYWINRNETGAITNSFWSFPDLRVNWLTTQWAGAAANGLYQISAEYYRYLSGPVDAPTVELIPASCFIPATAPVGTFLVRVDNSALTATFDHIYLRRPPPNNRYYRDSDLPLGPGDTATETPAQARALDYNDKGLCEILDLQGQYQVEILFSVAHAGQYLRSYSLTASPNDPAKGTVSYASDSFTGHTTASNPLWAGPGAQSVARGTFESCAYIFDLVALSRQQNGENYLQEIHPRRAYYVME